jgi:hypothetical protein
MIYFDNEEIVGMGLYVDEKPDLTLNDIHFISVN